MALRYALFLFGLVCAFIAFGHLAVGPRAIPGGVVTNATMDSEDRFYATLFLGFGVAIIWTALDLDRRATILTALLAVFFAGGLARIVSIAMVGAPSDLFLFLGSLELVLPPIFWWWMIKTTPAQR